MINSDLASGQYKTIFRLGQGHCHWKLLSSKLFSFESKVALHFDYESQQYIKPWTLPNLTEYVLIYIFTYKLQDQTGESNFAK